MPTILRIGPYRFFFYAGDRDEPLHIHVERDDNVKIMHSHVLKEIKGDGDRVTGVILENVLEKKELTLPADGVFIAIGFLPRTDLLVGQVELDERGYIKIIDGATTSKPGVFAAGDIIHPKYQQANVAAADGCKAAIDAIMYLDLKSLES